MSIQAAMSHEPELAWRDAFHTSLRNWRDGNAEGLENLFADFYEALKTAAHRCLRQESAHHTLQTTALVHELFIRLTRHQPPTFTSTQQFIFFASGLMRMILVDYARRKKSMKRGGRLDHLPLEDDFVGRDNLPIDPEKLLEIHDVVSTLAKHDPRQAHIVGLRVFLGFNHGEIARILDCSERTVYREWNAAKQRLAAQRGIRKDRTQHA